MARKSSRVTKRSSKKAKFTACGECRRRKIKCWPGYPCGFCLKYERECVRMAPVFEETQPLIETSSATETPSKSASGHTPLGSTSSCVGEAVSPEILHENSMNGDNSLRNTPTAVKSIREDQDSGIDNRMDHHCVYTLGSIMFDTSASLEQGITIVPIEAHMADSDMHSSGQVTFMLTDKTAIELAKMHKYIYSQQSLLYGGGSYSEIRQQELDHLNHQFTAALKNFNFSIDYEALGVTDHTASADICSRVETLISAMLYSQFALRFGLWAFISDFIW